MQFFKQQEKQQLFYIQPTAFSKNSPREQLAYCLGAALYMPATRDNIAKQLLEGRLSQATTVIIDLEDAVGEEHVQQGVQNIIELLKELKGMEQLPLLFVRPRHAEQFRELVAALGHLQHGLTGYVFPKFAPNNMHAYLDVLAEQRARGFGLYGMPVLETSELLYKEQRMESLLTVRAALVGHFDSILNVRIGTTDFAGLLGVRRTLDLSVYDMIVMRDCLADILNVFHRAEQPFVLSGGVWEYFDAAGDPKSAAMQGLLREVQLDKANGFVGKTVIHPSHINMVNATYVVTHEEYLDASAICAHELQDGVYKSEYANKMNEIKPHMRWAKKTLQRANVYGVLQPDRTFADLL